MGVNNSDEVCFVHPPHPVTVVRDFGRVLCLLGEKRVRISGGDGTVSSHMVA